MDDSARPELPLSQPEGQARAGPAGLRAALSSDSIWWLAAVAAAFTAAQLLFVSRRFGLSWDEVVYVSQVSGRAPAAFFDPARARGITLLAAPAILLTSSVPAMRAYLSVASGLGLFLVLSAWRPLRPARVLALAGLMFGGLWLAQFYGPQAMPDLWVAFAGLAAVGLFLRAARAPAAFRASRGLLAGLAAALGAAALVRPSDAGFLAAGLLTAMVTVRAWRRPLLAAAIALGLAAGAAEWLAEAFVRFGGPVHRMHLASAEQGGLGLHPAGAWAQLRALNGPTLCRPCTVSWRYPVLGAWWLALPALVLIGVYCARRAGLGRSALLTAWCGCLVAVPYLLLIDYAAPRFLLPAYALLAVPVADGLSWLVAGPAAGAASWRPTVRWLVPAAVAAQLLVQHAVLARQVAGAATLHAEYRTIAADLRRLGITPPCLVNGAQRIPVAYYAGCASTPNAAGRTAPSLARAGLAARADVVVLEWHAERPPAFARHWPREALPGARGPLRLVAFLPPAGSR